MHLAEYENRLLTVDEFRQEVGADYHERGIFPDCPDCHAKVTLRYDEILPQDPRSLFPDAAKIVTAHFGHFPNQADPECRFLSYNDPNNFNLTSGLNRNANDHMVARRQFVTEDGRVTQAGYWAGFMIARMLGRSQIHPDHNFYDKAQRMLDTELIPAANSKLWRRHAPGWARPYTWLLFHDFPLQKRQGNGYYVVQFKVEVPDNSIMDKLGHWHGPPAFLKKVFKDSGKDIARYEVREDSAFLLAREAVHWGANRPFAHVAMEKLHAYTLFPSAKK